MITNKQLKTLLIYAKSKEMVAKNDRQSLLSMNNALGFDVYSNKRITPQGYFFAELWKDLLARTRLFDESNFVISSPIRRNAKTMHYDGVYFYIDGEQTHLVCPSAEKNVLYEIAFTTHAETYWQKAGMNELKQKMVAKLINFLVAN